MRKTTWKRFLALFLVCMTLLTSMPVSLAADKTSAAAEVWSYFTENGGAIVTGYAGADSHAVIPDTLDGLPVTRVDSLGSGKNVVTHLTIPASVECIFHDAFKDCSLLESVSFAPGSRLTQIQERAFLGSGLTSLALPDSLTSIGPSAFESCPRLTAVSLPDSLASLPEKVFYNCPLLSSVTLPQGLKSIAREAFHNCSALREITFPQGLESIGNRAFLLSGLATVRIPESVQLVEDGAFQTNALTDVYLPNCKSTPQMRLASDAYNFHNEQNAGALTMHVFPGSFGDTWAKAQQKQLGFAISYEEPSRFTVSVQNETGVEVTEGVTLNWFKNGALAGTGREAAFFPSDGVITLQILLDESLSFIYYSPDMVTLTSDGTDHPVSITLQPIPNVTLSGRITDSLGSPLPGAEIVFQQGNQSPDVSAAAAQDGSFSCTLPDLPTTWSVSAEGFLRLDGSALSKPGSSSPVNLGSLILRPMPECRVTVEALEAQAVRPGETPRPEPLSSFRDLTFSVTNVSTGKAVTDFLVQEPYLVFPSGVKPGDTLSITAVRENAQTQAVTLDVSGKSTASFSFAQEGGLLVEEMTVGGCGQAVVLVFDGSGTSVTSGEAGSRYRSTPLPDGLYTVVLFEKNDLIRSVSDPDALLSLGLVEGRDYILLRDIQVRRGVLTVVSDLSVPALEPSRFAYTDPAGTQVSLNRSTTTAGKLELLTIRYAVKPGHTPSQLRVQLPQGLTMQGDPTLNGKTAAYSRDGSLVSIPVSAAAGTVRLYLAAEKAGSYSVTPLLILESGSQPLGTVLLEATAAAISVPDRTAHPQAAVSGTALPGSTVTVYRNGEAAATVTANSSGTWYGMVDLSGAGDYAFHELWAVVEKDGLRYETAHEDTLYAPAQVTVSKVHMYHTVRGKEQHTVFDYKNPDSSNFYLLEDREYSFRIEFDGNADLLGDVCLNVFTRDGEMYSFEAERDEAGCYVTSVSDVVPVNVGVTYASRLPEDFTYSTVTTEEYSRQFRQELMELSNLADTAFDVVAVTDGGDSDPRTTLVSFAYGNYPELGFDMLMTLLPYEEVHRQLSSGNFAEIAPGKYHQVSASETSLTYTCLDEAKQKAMSMSVSIDLSDPGSPALQAAGDRRSFTKQLVLEMLKNTPLPFIPGAGAIPTLAATWDLNDMRRLLHKEYMKACGEWDSLYLLWELKSKALCPDGTHQLKNAESLQNQIFALDDLLTSRYDSLKNSLDVFRQRIINGAAVSLITGGCGKLIGKGISKASFVESGGWYSPSIGSIPTYKIDPVAVKDTLDMCDLAGDFADVAADQVKGSLAEGAQDSAGYDLPEGKNSIWNFDDICSTPYYEAIIETFDNLIYLDFQNMRSKVLKNLRRCDDQPSPEPPLDRSPCPDKVPIEDPSGVVYEAVPSNLLSGVTAVIYREDQGEWNARDFDQVNPQVTGTDGFFHWDVPQGRYQVQFTKPGYEDAATQWLPVPPPQLGLMVPMVSTQAPAVVSATAYRDQAEILFSQYMDIPSVQAALSLSQDGAPVSIDVIPLNGEDTLDHSTRYATRFALRPTAGELSGPVTAVVSPGAKNYAGTALQASFASQPMEPRLRPTALTAENPTVGMDVPADLILHLEPGVPGETLIVENGTPSILGVSSACVVTDDSGNATLSVSGLMPGVAHLRVSHPDSGLSREVRLEVTRHSIPRVSASLPGGELLDQEASVPAGTAIVLSAPKSGAEIRYTLDGSCPKLPGALTYTSPISIERGGTLSAVAVVNGVYGRVSHWTISLDLSGVLTPEKAVSEMTWGVNLADLYIADVDRFSPPGSETGYYEIGGKTYPYELGITFWNGHFAHLLGYGQHAVTEDVSAVLPNYRPGDENRIPDWIGGLFSVGVIVSQPQLVELTLANTRLVKKNGETIPLTSMDGAYSLTENQFWGPDSYGNHNAQLGFDKSTLPAFGSDLDGAEFKTTITITNLPDQSSSKVDYLYQYRREKVDRETITDLYLSKGVNVFRLPVTWTPSVRDSDPFTVDRAWLDTVAQEVQYILDSGAYCILNMHNDYLQRSFVGDHWEENWMDPQYHDYVMTRFAAVWQQIAEYFKDYSDHLILEPCNEPTVNWNGSGDYTAFYTKQAAYVNEMNRVFVDTVRKTGGGNRTRLLCVVPAEYSRSAWLHLLEPPQDDYLIAQVHSYDSLTPVGDDPHHDYVREVDTVFRQIDDFKRRTGIPVIMGETGIPLKTSFDGSSLIERFPEDGAERVSYFFRKAKTGGVPCLWWEDFNYSDTFNIFWLYDKHTSQWRRPQLLQAIMEVVGAEETPLPAKAPELSVTKGSAEVTIPAGTEADWVLAAAYDSVTGRFLSMKMEKIDGRKIVCLQSEDFRPEHRVQAFLLNESYVPTAPSADTHRAG